MEIYKIVSTKRGDGRTVEASSREGLAEKLTGTALHMMDGELIETASKTLGVPEWSLILISPTGSPELYRLAAIDREVQELREQLALATQKRNEVAAEAVKSMPASHVGATLGVSSTAVKKIVDQAK